MNRVVMRVVVAAMLLCLGTAVTRAQAPDNPPKAQEPAKPGAEKQQPPSDEEEGGGNPFAPEPAPGLPAGMSGSDVNDPRYKLTPGLYDAGETANRTHSTWARRMRTTRKCRK
jgi:hypothetical protein